MTKKKKRKENIGLYYDYNLIAVIILLVCFGLLILYSTSAYIAELNYGDDMFFFSKQATISCACIVLAVIASIKLDYHWINTMIAWGLYGASLFCMILVAAGFGSSSHGATRWLKIGPIQFQPAEIAKIAIIVLLAKLIAEMGRRATTLKGSAMLMGLGGLQSLAAYFFTENLSTAIIILGITFFMVFIANPNWFGFIVLMAAGAILVVVGVFFCDAFLQDSTSFRVQRIITWLHPERDVQGDGFQTMQALYAIGSGGLKGRGLGNSIQKLGSVPEAQNDMIFSIICEELGILGAIIVISLFLYLLLRLMMIASNASDYFGSLIASGVFIHIAIQVILNIAVVLNVIPNTGVTLPFISYGGTSIGFIMMEMALALSVSRHIKG